jgi:hypothetical protein
MFFIGEVQLSARATCKSNGVSILFFTAAKNLFDRPAQTP